MKRKRELKENVIHVMYNSICQVFYRAWRTAYDVQRKRIPITYFKITFQKSVEGHATHWQGKIK